ncbi:MAG: hypothetical protein JXB85_11315 [Anaerolineales bacterium]|nr:hypothetical protein [Anaerolineales bacterium]
MKPAAIILIAIILLAACSTTPMSEPAPAPPDPQAAVYTAVLQALYPAEAYVLMDTTQSASAYVSLEDVLQRSVRPGLNGLDPATADDFLDRNQTESRLPPDLDLGAAYTLVDTETLQPIFANEDAWERFYTAYPGVPGILTLSQAGFNAEMTQALVYIGIQSDWLSGEGSYALLEQVNGVWQVIEQVVVWMS